MIKYTSYCRHCIHFKDDYYFSTTCAECFWVTASSPPTNSKYLDYGMPDMLW